MENKNTANNWPEHRKLAGILGIVVGVISIAFAALWALNQSQHPEINTAGKWGPILILGIVYLPISLGVTDGNILLTRIAFAINTLLIALFLYFGITEQLFMTPLLFVIVPTLGLMGTIELILFGISIPPRKGNT